MHPRDLRQFAKQWRDIARPSDLERAVVEFPEKVSVKERLKGNRHTGGVLVRTSAFRAVVRIGGHGIGVDMGLFDPRKAGVASRPLSSLAGFWTECLRRGLFDYLQQALAQKLVPRKEAAAAAPVLGQGFGGWDAWRAMEASTWVKMSDWVRGGGGRLPGGLDPRPARPVARRRREVPQFAGGRRHTAGRPGPAHRRAPHAQDHAVVGPAVPGVRAGMDDSWVSRLAPGDPVIVKQDSPGRRHMRVERVESVRKDHLVVAGILYRRADGSCAGRRVMYPSHLVPWTEALGERVARASRARDTVDMLRRLVSSDPGEELVLKVADALAPLEEEIRRA